MWSYYDLTIAKQVHADQVASVGCRLPAAARREVTEETIARHLNQERQLEQEAKRAARRTAIANIVNTVKAISGRRTALAR